MTASIEGSAARNAFGALLGMTALLSLCPLSRCQADAVAEPSGARRVMLFIGANDETEVFDPVSQDTLRIVTRAETDAVLADPHAFAKVDIVVWGRNCFRDLKRPIITDAAKKALQTFVRDGGDLVYFEQFGMGNMDVVGKLFGVKVNGGPSGAQIVDAKLQTAATADGYTEASLKKIHFYNSYSNLPKDAAILIRAGKKHVPTGVVVPFGKGRLILLATTMDDADKKLDEEFFEQIYHYKAWAAANKPPANPPEVDGDPMDWSPPVPPPPLRQVLDPATYARRFKAALAKINVASLRDPSRPPGGEYVFLVAPGSSADQQGMKVGDIVTSVDGIALDPRSGQLDGADRVFGQKRTLFFWSPTGGEKSMTTDALAFGYWYRGGRRLDETYARSTDRDPRWDDAVLVAAANELDDPDLAETALLHAQQAGYQGRLLYVLAARIAFQQFRYDDALAYGWYLLSTGRPLGNDLAVTLNQAAIVDFKFEQAEELARRYPSVIHEDPRIVQAIKAYRAMPSDKSPNPIARLGHLQRKAVRSFSPFIPPGGFDITQGFAKWSADAFNRSHRIDLNIPSAHYNLYLLQPGFANLAVTVRFNLYRTDQLLTPFSTDLWIDLVDLNDPNLSRAIPLDSLKFSYGPCEEATVAAGGLPDQLLWTAPPHMPWRVRGTLKMVILHNRCEVTLDGRRIYYGPILAPEAKRKYGLWIQVIGMSGRIERPIIEELIDPATTRPAR